MVLAPPHGHTVHLPISAVIRVLLFPTSYMYRINKQGTSLAVQWLRVHAHNAGAVGSIPGQGTKIPHAA